VHFFAAQSHLNQALQTAFPALMILGSCLEVKVTAHTTYTARLFTHCNNLVTSTTFVMQTKHFAFFCPEETHGNA